MPLTPRVVETLFYPSVPRTTKSQSLVLMSVDSASVSGSATNSLVFNTKSLRRSLRALEITLWAAVSDSRFR